MEESCKCKGKDIVLTTFKVSNSRTLLLCMGCNAIVAEWEDKVYPRHKEYDNPKEFI